jgi:DNA invertase Pin-like site-specific DNA recombinase
VGRNAGTKAEPRESRHELRRSSFSTVEELHGIPCVIYAAKSTADLRGSIPGQVAECRAMIATHPGRTVAGEYTDEAFSAYSANRGPGLVEAMQHAEDLAEERGLAELWVQHSDRLARGDGHSARHTVEVALWALKRDVKIRSIHDPDTFRDLLYAVVTGQRNHEDSRRKGLSVQAGRKRAAARGDYIGYKPDGYRLAIELDSRGRVHKRMEIDPDRRELIETLFRLGLAGKRPEAIARTLNRKGWYTKPSRRGCLPTRWGSRRVMELLANPRYAALAIYGGEIVARGHWPAYISERQHRRLRAGVAKGRPTKAFRQRETYLLAKLVRCGLCGARLYGATGLRRADGTFARRYLCASNTFERVGAGCKTGPLDAEFTEATFVSSLRLLLLEPSPRSPAGADGTASYGRRQLLDAVLADDQARVDLALERMFVEMQPQLRASTMSRRRSRDLDVASQFEEWAERERTGRTETSRQQAPALNRILRGWFSEVTVTIDPSSVLFIARRKPTRGTRYASTSEAQIDRGAWVRYDPLSRRAGPRYQPWAKPEIIGALQAWADEHGRAPCWRDLKTQRGRCPSAQTMLHHFGGWNAAILAAGLEPYKLTPSGRRQRWDDQDIIQALNRWATEHGHPPADIRWRPAAREHPCSKTVRDHFGSWQAALKAAGLDSKRAGRPAGR